MGRALSIALSLYATVLMFENRTGNLIASIPVEGAEAAGRLMTQLDAKYYLQHRNRFDPRIGCRVEFTSCCRFKFTSYNYPPIIESVSKFCGL